MVYGHFDRSGGNLPERSGNAIERAHALKLQSLAWTERTLEFSIPRLNTLPYSVKHDFSDDAANYDGIRLLTSELFFHYLSESRATEESLRPNS